MCDPQYQELLDAQIPRSGPLPGVVIKVIAGDSHGIVSKVYNPDTNHVLDFAMEPHQVVEQDFPLSYTGFIYILSGKTYLNAAKGRMGSNSRARRITH